MKGPKGGHRIGGALPALFPERGARDQGVALVQAEGVLPVQGGHLGPEHAEDPVSGMVGIRRVVVVGVEGREREGERLLPEVVEEADPRGDAEEPEVAGVDVVRIVVRRAAAAVVDLRARARAAHHDVDVEPGLGRHSERPRDRLVAIAVRLPASEVAVRGGDPLGLRKGGAERIVDELRSAGQRGGAAIGPERAGFQEEARLGIAFPPAGDDVDDAAHGVGTVEDALGSPDDLDALDIVGREVGEIEAAVGGDRVVGLDAVDHDEGVAGAGPAHEDEGGSAQGPVLVDVEGRGLAERVQDHAVLGFLEVAGRDRGDVAGDVFLGLVHPGRGDDDVFLFVFLLGNILGRRQDRPHHEHREHESALSPPSRGVGNNEKRSRAGLLALVRPTGRAFPFTYAPREALRRNSGEDAAVVPMTVAGRRENLTPFPWPGSRDRGRWVVLRVTSPSARG
jgi:hypothetical protein